MYHKNYVGVSRKKTVDSTITQMEIIPQCCKLQEFCVTERAIVDVNVEKHCSDRCMSLIKKNKNSSVKTLNKNQPSVVDAALFKSHHLKQNKRHEQLPTRFRNHKRRNEDRNSSDPTSSSSFSSGEVICAQRTYTKNKAVQCGDLAGIAGKENDPISTVQALLKGLKRKLKGDSYMSSTLDKLENEINKLIFGQANRQNITDFPRDNKQYKRHPLLTTAVDHLTLLSNKVEFNSEINAARANLDATCRELEHTCEKLKKERDTSIKLAADKNADLVESLVREAELKRKLEETNFKIKDMSVKLENYAGFMRNLNEQLKRLQYENKEAKRLKQQVSHLTSLLRTMTEENKILLTDLQQVTVERNKLQIAVTIQEQKMAKKNKSLQKNSPLDQPQQLVQSINGVPEWHKSNELYPSNVQSTKPSSDALSNSPSIGLAPSLCRNDTDNSASRTPSPSSDRLLQIQPFQAEGDDDERISTSIPFFFVEQPQPQQSLVEQQLNLDKLNELKEEIKNIFKEVKHLADDMTARPVGDFKLGGGSGGVNWSQINSLTNGNTNNETVDVIKI